MAFKGNIGKYATAQDCVKLAVKEFGQLDILINNASVFVETNYLTDYSEEAFAYMLWHNNRTVFIMSKAALPELQKTHGNIVGPGPIDTASTHKETGLMDSKTEKTNSLAVLTGRQGTVEEVANAYLFLASDGASYVTSAFYGVDGGITIAKGPAGNQASSFFKKDSSRKSPRANSN